MPLWRSPVSPCRTHAVACSYTRTHRDTRSDGGHRRQRDTERLRRRPYRCANRLQQPTAWLQANMPGCYREQLRKARCMRAPCIHVRTRTCASAHAHECNRVYRGEGRGRRGAAARQSSRTYHRKRKQDTRQANKTRGSHHLGSGDGGAQASLAQASFAPLSPSPPPTPSPPATSRALHTSGLIPNISGSGQSRATVRTWRDEGWEGGAVEACVCTAVTLRAHARHTQLPSQLLSRPRS